MADFTDILSLVPALAARCGDGDELLGAVSGLTDAEIIAALDETVQAAGVLDQVRLALIGVVAARSTRGRGHAGLAQSRGHRGAADMVAKVTGSSRSDANRDVRVGSAMFDIGDGSGAGEASGGGSRDNGMPGGGDGAQSDDPGTHDSDAGSPSGDSDAGASSSAGRAPWYEPLRVALRCGTISSAQFDAIRTGLGDPPADAAAGDVARAFADTVEAWRCAAELLIEEAAERTLEELRSAARTLRDHLDPDGAAARYRANHDARAFRMWRDTEGRRRASISFDDDGGTFLETVLNAALRPRRGGPRFVDSAEKEQAADLARDPRTNDQLAYDLLLDLLRAGTLANPADVFGTRQAGVRIVHVVNTDGDLSPIARSEDGLTAFPAGAAAQQVCSSGYVTVTVDSCGNPLDVGREQRLFTPRQRIALAIRDGGCRWPGCDRPASYCEAHHIDHWAGGGRTDIDRGILLCRFHHMELHHNGWTITRDGTAEFVLHDPHGRTHHLRPRGILTTLWAGLAPPPKRFHTAA